MQLTTGPSAAARTPAAGSSPEDTTRPGRGPVTRTPNVRLRLSREERGWSQERLATEIRRFSVVHEGREAGVTGNMICKWEKGDKKPSLRYQRLLRALFGRSSVELGFVDDEAVPAVGAMRADAMRVEMGRPAGPAATGTLGVVHPVAGAVSGAAALLSGSGNVIDPNGLPVERRDVLRLLAAAGGVAVVPLGVGADGPPWERLSAALRRRASVTPELADELGQHTAGLYGLEERVPARMLMPRVTDHLERLIQLLESTGRSPVRRSLTSTAGETAALAGWLAFDSNDLPAATAYYRVAIEAARDADDHGLWACVLGYESYQTASQGRHDQACALLGEAQRRAAAGSTVMTRAWLAAREAEEQAARGEGRAALTALDRAQDAFDRGESGGGRVWTHFFDRGRLDGLKVTTYTRLRRPAAAFAAATEALRAAAPGATKKRSLLLSDIAEVHIQRREIDAACHFAAESLAIVAQTDFSLGLARIRRTREHLRPWQHTQLVRDLDDQLRALA
ncbi:HTH cro/C1-type domain-containing protein [Frankia sp. AiPs1]|uniref:helix-turn-helix domain-containing protein n=1 Tax=Frankia sp. AiPa1 TaxID=573492 RepID=UPI00202AE02B|nr:helix-turn-helix transcriptional regulator [Frankia sp. AiPa1]MCL9757997.1 helix-turn-helix transcriptional regulator [Frankia sp. AiPa1]